MKTYQVALLALLPAVLAAPQGLPAKTDAAKGTGNQNANANQGGNTAATGNANANANKGGANTGAAGNGNANAGTGNADSGNTGNTGTGNVNQGTGNANAGNTGNANSGNTAASNSTAAGALTIQAPANNQGNAGGVDNFNTAQAKVDQQTAELMQTAVESWRIDTGRVSNFLNTGNALAQGDAAVFKNAANVAASAEVDELTHKQVLDQFMPNDANVQAANATLSNGAFQLVVDKLQNMATNGPATAQQDIDDINNDRCVNVLPNIDAYMKSAALMIGDPNVVESVRPAACGDIVAKAAASGSGQQQNVNTANQLASQFQGENPGTTQQEQRLPAGQRGN